MSSNVTQPSASTVSKTSSATQKPDTEQPKPEQWTCSECAITINAPDRVKHLCFHRDHRYHCKFCDAFFHESQNDIHINEPLHIRNATNRPNGRRPKVRGFMSDAAYAELCRDPESYEHGTIQWSYMDMHESDLQEEYLSPDPTEEEDPEYWFWIWKHGKDGEGVGAERSKEVDHAKDKSSDYEIENDDYNHDDDCRDDYGDDYEDDYGDDNDFEDWTCGSPNY